MDADLMPWEELRYGTYAERFGWHPELVDQLTLDQEDWILPVANAITSERNRRQEAAQKAADANTARGR